MGYDRKLNTLDFPVTPRGYRILGRIPRLPESIVENVVREFGSFDLLLGATSGELESVEGVAEVRAKEIREGLQEASGDQPGRQVPPDLDAGPSTSAAGVGTGVVGARAPVSDSEDSQRRPPFRRQQVETETEIDELAEVVNITYKVGDKVVYPHHGAGKVLKKEKKEMLGEVREYLTIKILHNDMTVMVPCDNADRAGLRRVIGEDDVERVLAVLRDDMSAMPKNWNRRFKHNRDKMKTGDVFELAEVVRNLAIRDFDKGLSTGEKQMFTRAKKILSSELMYALDMEEKEAEEYLDQLLEETNTERNGAANRNALARRR